uniref:Uncharacterized protein n=1 Tax=Romanomermis culicivorax TaxID=13658 RepID=A0A915KT61_ROMCU
MRILKSVKAYSRGNGNVHVDPDTSNSRKAIFIACCNSIETLRSSGKRARMIPFVPITPVDVHPRKIRPIPVYTRVNNLPSVRDIDKERIAVYAAGREILKSFCYFKFDIFYVFPNFVNVVKIILPGNFSPIPTLNGCNLFYKNTKHCFSAPSRLLWRAICCITAAGHTGGSLQTEIPFSNESTS